jgi:hypothetical protein
MSKIKIDKTKTELQMEIIAYGEACSELTFCEARLSGNLHEKKLEKKQCLKKIKDIMSEFQKNTISSLLEDLKIIVYEAPGFLEEDRKYYIVPNDERYPPIYRGTKEEVVMAYLHFLMEKE